MSINSIPTASALEREHTPVLRLRPVPGVAGLIDRARVIGTLVIFAAIAALIYGAR
jgi:hypothetical protein